MRDVLDPVARVARPLAELPRQQRVGRLVGGRCGVTWRMRIAHQAGGTACAELRERRRRGAKLARGEREEPLEPIAERVELAPAVRLYGLPPTIASLEWKSRLSTGSPRAARSARQRRSCPRATSTTAAASACCSEPQRAQHALGRVRPRRARVGVLQRPRQRAGSAPPRPAPRARRCVPGVVALS